MENSKKQFQFWEELMIAVIGGIIGGAVGSVPYLLALIFG